MSREGQQQPFDLDMPIPPEPDPDKEQDDIARAIGEAADVRDKREAQNRKPLLSSGASLDERLARRIDDIAEADTAVNKGVSPKHRDDTREEPVSRIARDQVQAAGDLAEEQAAELRRVTRAAALQAEANERAERAKRGRQIIADHWTPNLSPGQDEVRKAIEKGKAARGYSTDEHSDAEA